MKPTILLVEDSQIQKLANEKILTRAGYLVLLAGDGEDALRLAREARPDLMLLDMVLPKLSGFEVLQTLKRHPMTASIPVIVLSQLSPIDQAKATAAGAVGYFDKSKLAVGLIGEDELIGVMKKTLSDSPRIGVQAAQAKTAAHSW
jgi:CheY-like chemotaxis protein